MTWLSDPNQPRAELKTPPVFIMMRLRTGDKNSPGDSTASKADINVTRDHIRAGQLIKIEVLDHVTLGNSSRTLLRGVFFASFAKPLFYAAWHSDRCGFVERYSA